jgi:hypothetical protein
LDRIELQVGPNLCGFGAKYMPVNKWNKRV